MDAQVGCVDETALDDVREVSAEIFKGHPKSGKDTAGLCCFMPLNSTLQGFS